MLVTIVCFLSSFLERVSSPGRMFMVPCRAGGCLSGDKGKSFLAGAASCWGQVLGSSVQLCGASLAEVLECRDRP